MKKLLLISLFLITCTTMQAQHIFSDNTQAVYKDGSWGRFVYTSEEIRVTNMAKAWGSGTYKIEMFEYNRSKPYAYFLVEYSGEIKKNWYYWTVSDCSSEYFDFIMKGGRIEVRSEQKFSLMSNGKSGAINIFFYDLQTTGIAFILKN